MANTARKQELIGSQPSVVRPPSFILCSGVLTTIDFCKNFFHRIYYRAGMGTIVDKGAFYVITIPI